MKKRETTEVGKMLHDAVLRAERTIKVCNGVIERLNHPELYGCLLDKCSCVVINVERMMAVTTDANRMTTYEFAPLYPTFFTREAANRILKHDVYKDCNGVRIPLVIVGQLEYYMLLKSYTETGLSSLKAALECITL